MEFIELKRVFGEHGLIGKRFSDYQYRIQQEEMALACSEVFDADGKKLIVEAPTGVGKSFAYLVPLVMKICANEEVGIVVTTNVLLQNQLMTKDIPFVVKMLEEEGLIRKGACVSALIKGKGHYACKRKRESETFLMWVGTLMGEEKQIAKEVIEWFDDTETGDRSEITAKETFPMVYRMLMAESDECLGKDCPHKSECFYEMAKRRAREANLVVCNYHILFSHFQVKNEYEGRGILRDYNYVVCDEAHSIEGAARGFLGYDVSNYGVGRVVNNLRKWGDWELGGVLEEQMKEFFEKIKDGMGKETSVTLKKDFVECIRICDLLLKGKSVLEKKKIDEINDGKSKEDLADLQFAIDQAKKTSDKIRDIVGQNERDYVYWVEKNERGLVKLCCAPVVVSEYLENNLFDSGVSAVATSATLATGKDFKFVVERLGLGGAKELILGSPFNFEKQMITVCPVMRYDVTGFDKSLVVEERAAIIRKVIQDVGGKTMVLFTSWGMMDAVYEKVKGCWGKILKQGDKSREELYREFREDVESVLFATESFWTGVDVRGESLSCLVIDKLPFPTNNDPVGSWYHDRSKDWFKGYYLPVAMLKFKQGVGRLIRSAEDKGVVVVLDNRIIEKGYGINFLRALPRHRVSRDLEDVGKFFEEKDVM